MTAALNRSGCDLVSGIWDQQRLGTRLSQPLICAVELLSSAKSRWYRLGTPGSFGSAQTTGLGAAPGLPRGCGVLPRHRPRTGGPQGVPKRVCPKCPRGVPKGSPRCAQRVFPRCSLRVSPKGSQGVPRGCPQKVFPKGPRGVFPKGPQGVFSRCSLRVSPEGPQGVPKRVS